MRFRPLFRAHKNVYVFHRNLKTLSIRFYAILAYNYNMQFLAYNF